MLETGLLHLRTTTRDFSGSRGLGSLVWDEEDSAPSFTPIFPEVYSQFIFPPSPSPPLPWLCMNRGARHKGCALQAQRCDSSWTPPLASAIASGFLLIAGLVVKRSQLAPRDKERHKDARQQ